MSSSDELDPGRVDGVVGGAAEQEEEEAALVRCVKGSCDQGVDLQRDMMQNVNTKKQHGDFNRTFLVL